jgi:uncharacterized protein
MRGDEKDNRRHCLSRSPSVAWAEVNMAEHLIAQLVIVWSPVLGGLAVAVNWLLRYRARSVRIVGAAGLPVAIFLVALITSVPSRAQVEAPPSARSNGIPQDDVGRFVSKVLGSTEFQWKQIFAQDARSYRAPVLVLYRGVTHASCGGLAKSSMGPFYCPVDQKVYLDTSFFDEIATRFRGCDIGSKSCQSADAYVIAHEIGHHVQNLLGILPKVRQAQRAAGSSAEANYINVQLELQADCLAGIWAHRENQTFIAKERRPLFAPDDIVAAMRTAESFGNDRLQRMTQGYVVPDSFTHGSSEQRKRWFMRGFESGAVASCNTFAPERL